MNVTFLCPDIGVGGGIRVILAFADRLAARGHSVEVVVPAKHRLKAMWRQFRRVGPTWLPRFRASIRWVNQWRTDGLPSGDVIIASWWPTATIVAEAPRRCGVKFYLIQHYESLYMGSPDVVDETYRLRLRKIVVSTWLKEIMREKFRSHADVLVPPVDPDLFHPLPVMVTTARPRVLMLYSELDWKGVGDGLEAVARVKRNVPSLHLVGFGVKPPHGNLPFSEFHTNPRQDRLAQLYSGCDIYLCPSWDEGLGLPSMEAMACGCALVTFDTGGCRDYARNGETALVARRRDINDLATQLERAITNEELRGRIAKAGTTFLRTTFTWDDTIRRLEQLFRNAIESRLEATTER